MASCHDKDEKKKKKRRKKKKKKKKNRTASLFFYAEIKWFLLFFFLSLSNQAFIPGAQHTTYSPSKERYYLQEAFKNKVMTEFVLLSDIQHILLIFNHYPLWLFSGMPAKRNDCMCVCVCSVCVVRACVCVCVCARDLWPVGLSLSVGVICCCCCFICLLTLFSRNGSCAPMGDRHIKEYIIIICY